MNALVAAHFRAGAEVRFLVVAAGATTARPLNLTGIDNVIAICPTLGGAMIGLAA
jgi:hypothetical protein